MIGFDNVAHDFGSGALLSELTLELTAGSFHFLTGPSGAGKSTFLKLCYGELTPTSGTVSFLGRNIAGMNRDELALMRRDIGVVHQDCQFLDHLTLAENVALPLAVSGRRIDPGELAELLGWVGLSNQAQALPPTLSGGERQRGALARAFEAQDWLRDALSELERALAMDPSVRGDPHVLRILLRILESPTYHDGAANLIRTYFGEEARPALRSAIVAASRPEVAERLRAFEATL